MPLLFSGLRALKDKRLDNLYCGLMLVSDVPRYVRRLAQYAPQLAEVPEHTDDIRLSYKVQGLCVLGPNCKYDKIVHAPHNSTGAGQSAIGKRADDHSVKARGC